MKFLLLSILAASPHQAGAVNLRLPDAAAGSSNSTELPPLGLVMFDHTYMKLFDCWLRYWQRQKVHLRNRLDVVVYDKAAKEHVEELLATYPQTVRDLQLVTFPGKKQRILTRGQKRWSSDVYQAYFWQAILYRLEQNRDVLHMDLDALVVGADAWSPVASADPDADIVAPKASVEPGQQYVLYRNTKTTRVLVKYFASRWEEWLAKGDFYSTPPLPAEQNAIRDYIRKYNPKGCNKTETRFVCEMHDGGTFKWVYRVPGVAHGIDCNYPDGCKEQHITVAHGRSHLREGVGSFCPAEEAREAQESEKQSHNFKVRR